MPISKKVDPKTQLTIYLVQGDLVFEELLEAFQAFYETGQATQNVLWDMRQVQKAEVSQEQFNQLKDYILGKAAARPTGKTVYVAGPAMAQGLAALEAMLSQAREIPYSTYVAESIEEALRWLGLESE